MPSQVHQSSSERGDEYGRFHLVGVDCEGAEHRYSRAVRKIFVIEEGECVEEVSLGNRTLSEYLDFVEKVRGGEWRETYVGGFAAVLKESFESSPR